MLLTAHGSAVNCRMKGEGGEGLPCLPHKHCHHCSHNHFTAKRKVGIAVKPHFNPASQRKQQTICLMLLLLPEELSSHTKVTSSPSWHHHQQPHTLVPTSAVLPQLWTRDGSASPIPLSEEPALHTAAVLATAITTGTRQNVNKTATARQPTAQAPHSRPSWRSSTLELPQCRR